MYLNRHDVAIIVVQFVCIQCILPFLTTPCDVADTLVHLACKVTHLCAVRRRSSCSVLNATVGGPTPADTLLVCWARLLLGQPPDVGFLAWSAT